MQQLDIIGLSAHSTACIINTVIFIFLRLNKSVDNKHLRLLLGNFSVIFAIGFGNSMVNLIVIANCYNSTAIEKYSFPVTSALQICIAIYSFLSFFHIPQNSKKTLKGLLGTLVVIGLAVPLIFVEFVKSNRLLLDSDSMLVFLENKYVDIVFYTMMSIITLITAFYLAALFKLHFDFKRFARSKEKSRYEHSQLSLIITLVLCTACFLLFLYNNLISKGKIKFVTTILWTVIDIGFLNFVINSRRALLETEAAQRDYRHAMMALDSSNPKDSVKGSKMERVIEEKMLIKERLAAWESDESQPFNRHGITLETLSQETGIPMGILNRYLHLLYGQCFYDWINDLRYRYKTKEGDF